MAITAGKIAVVVFEKVLETIEDQTQLSDMCSRWQPDAASMQNSANFMWRPVEQQAVIQEGWDMAGKETGIIEETYPANLGLPQNDMVEVRADDMRDMKFWERRGVRSGKQQVVKQNTTIANAIVNQGSLYYQSNTTSGFDFISEAQALMNEQQRTHIKRNFILNDRSTKKYGEDLAARQTLQGQPATTWKTGQIGQNIAEFDIYTGSYLPTLDGGSASTTATGAQTFAPEAGGVDAVGTVTNVDYRTATITVADSSGFAVGDKITIANMNAVGISDKTDTALLRTFTVIATPSGTTMTIYPKPIAADDGGLTTLELAYANVSTKITGGEAITQVNTVAGMKTNIFYDEDAVEVYSGSIPAGLFSEFNGMKVIDSTMSNGQPMYMLYDANIESMNFRFRLFTWYGITIKDPQRCGVAGSIA